MASNDEADPKDTASVENIADDCKRYLVSLGQDEALHGDVTKVAERYWASRQLAEFNLFCDKLGVYRKGLRSIDIRLKDVPDILKLLSKLLQWLKHDLEDLQQPEPPRIRTRSIDGLQEVIKSDSSSFISFKSLSSLRASSAADDDTAPPWEQRKNALQRHIEDTIDRLHGHAGDIERAGATHRRARMEVYLQKDRNEEALGGFRNIALRKINTDFPAASSVFRGRMADSVARRRMRFRYLEEHQKKRSIDNSPPRDQLKVKAAQTTATKITKLDVRPQSKQKQPAESVASVALKNPGFPPPPPLDGSSFQCPYCRLEFRASEAQKDRWRMHVINDFEPYFCTIEDCKAPFDVPNTFNGLLSHLQEHNEERFHVNLPDGEHGELSESDFENYITRHGEWSEEMRSTIKEASRHKAAYLFQMCPFCGGIPDILMKRFPDVDTPEYQMELRKHVKEHMLILALFLQPYREDFDNRTITTSAHTRRTNPEQIVEDPSEFYSVCDEPECDCKKEGEHAMEDGLANSQNFEVAAEFAGKYLQDTDFWGEMFANDPRYFLYEDRYRPITDDYYMSDDHLRLFQRTQIEAIKITIQEEDDEAAHVFDTGTDLHPWDKPVYPLIDDAKRIAERGDGDVARLIEARLRDNVVRHPQPSKLKFWPAKLFDHLFQDHDVEYLVEQLVREDSLPVDNNRDIKYWTNIICGHGGDGLVYRRLMAIFTLVGKAQCIYNCISERIADNGLPYDPEDVVLGRLKLDPRDIDLFCSYQGQLSVPLFRAPQHKAPFGENAVLHVDLTDGQVQPWDYLTKTPRQTELEDYARTADNRSTLTSVSLGGGYGEVHRVIIHPWQHEFHEVVKMWSSNTNIFALKRLFTNDSKRFANETAQLKRFGGQHSHIVTLLATIASRKYSKIDYFLLFPWAESDLLRYWKKDPNPVMTHSRCVWIAEQCYGIVDAVAFIHDPATDVYFDIRRSEGDTASVGYFFEIKEQVTKCIEGLHHHPNCTSFFHDFLELIQNEMLIVESDEPPVKRIKGNELRERVKIFKDRCIRSEGYCMERCPDQAGKSPLIRRQEHQQPVLAKLNKAAEEALNVGDRFPRLAQYSGNSRLAYPYRRSRDR
ncbi:hypothetical protein VPNG_03035 [Cytospora leucostoma]|uniref:4Fe-4S ferredoxin-type domain-containing protein n=1 Tax=Cytospora leucostoma TaxID=1230097 RepID=A0A423XG19_9PEZI|nr:hypothetical protein VPNG_03035 [Cytospora leucostoma]